MLLAVVNRQTILNGHIVDALRALSDGDVAQAKATLEVAARGADGVREAFTDLGELLRRERFGEVE